MRVVKVITHPRRAAAAEARTQICSALDKQGITAVGAEYDGEVELIIVLGGDGTILGAIEAARAHSVPLIGVNLGHVGFLAEAEQDSLTKVAEHVATQDYRVEERMTIDIHFDFPNGKSADTWAANEIAFTRNTSSTMSEIMLGVDHQPVSSYACDGMVIATPTGSTAYSFSAGGPVIWPDVEAMVLVPLAAHALFTRPLVVGPASTVELIIVTEGGISVADGRRSFPTVAGTQIVIRRGKKPLRLARIDNTPFSGRLVAKFGLPVKSWKYHGANRD